MSLILDALRKSDMERSRHKAPDIAAIGGSAPERSAPRWLWPVIALLVVNALFLGYLLMKPATQTAGDDSDAVPRPELSNPAAAPVNDTATESVASIPATKADVRSLLDETARDAAAENTADTPTVRSEPTAPASAEGREDLPSYATLAASGEIQLAPVSLELHVYSAQPSARFAFINGQKVTEGDRLNGGGNVEQITRYGVVLEHQGRRFVLARD